MIQDIIKARLNLNAVMRNLEVLPEIDAQTAELIREWSVSIRFLVRGDESVRLLFNGGRCVFQSETYAASDVALYFLSPAHLNAMFENRANPIPLRGFLRLGFLKNEFPRLTDRLEYFLKPDDARLREDAYVRVNTALSLYTGVFAVCELALLDPIARKVVQQMPAGTLQLSVLPEGPHAWIRYDGRGGATAGRGLVENPTAVLSFRDCQTACQLFNGRLDGFSAIALGDIKMRGLVPLVENTNLILDRIPLYIQ